MTTLWIFIALFVLVSLVLIWLPHFRQKKMLQAEEAGVRKTTNLELFNNRLATLEKELEEELLDQTEFDALKKELEISLLQDMKQGEDESLVNNVKPKGLLWPSLMSIVVLSVSGYLYSELGAYKDLDKAVPDNPHAGMDASQIMAQRIGMMEAQLKSEPENSQLMFSLGHAYINANRFDDAVKSFDNAMKLVGTHAELIGPKATALYYKANQRMTPEVKALVDQALALDPKDPSTLLLVGMDSFFTADYQAAINAWQTILDSDRNDVDRSAIMNAIESAKMRINATSGEMPQDATHQQATQGKTTVTVEVSISPELAGQVSDTDTLFIFARNVEGSKAPLAATKLSAKDLPTKVVLDGSTNMMGGSMTLSDAKNVEIIAILSKHGSIKAQAGDIEGRIATVEVGTTGKLVLDTKVQ